MQKQSGHIAVIVHRLAVAARLSATLKLDEPLDERIGHRLAQRIAHRHIDLFDLLGNRIEYGQQQRLVGQHNGGLLAGPYAALDQSAQKFVHVLALHAVGRGRHDFDPLRPAEAVAGETLAGRRREIPDILAQKQARLVIGITDVIIVVVPVELDPAAAVHPAEKPFLALRQRVESRHDIARLRIVGPFDGLLSRKALGGLAVNHALVSEPLLAQTIAETVIDVGHASPNRHKTLFFLGKLAFEPEASPETGDHLDLFGSQIGAVALERFQVAHIGEKHVGIDQVLVDLIEIGQQHAAPEIKRVETFVVIAGIDFVKLGNELDLIAQAHPGHPLHDFPQTLETGLPQRTPSHRGERIAEKEPCPAARKHHAQRRNLVAVTVVQPFGQFGYKAFHRMRSYKPNVPFRFRKRHTRVR